MVAETCLATWLRDRGTGCQTDTVMWLEHKAEQPAAAAAASRDHHLSGPIGRKKGLAKEDTDKVKSGG